MMKINLNCVNCGGWHYFWVNMFFLKLFYPPPRQCVGEALTDSQTALSCLPVLLLSAVWSDEHTRAPYVSHWGQEVKAGVMQVTCFINRYSALDPWHLAARWIIWEWQKTEELGADHIEGLWTGGIFDLEKVVWL